MLTLVITPRRLWDERSNKFVKLDKETTIVLEHSLVSISKWEARWHKAFLADRKKTSEEMIDYIRCMTITKNVNPLVYNTLTDEQFQQIADYIEDPMSAAVVHGGKKKTNKREVLTSDMIYYYMVAAQIDWQAQTWHLNRLLKLIEIYGIKQEENERDAKAKQGKYKKPSKHRH